MIQLISVFSLLTQVVSKFNIIPTMKTMLFLLFVLMPSTVLISQSTAALNSQASELRFAVHKINPYIAISTDQLNKATSIADLNYRFKTSWIREYLSVEIITLHNDIVQSAISENGQLTPLQKERLRTADRNKEITVNIHYIPENTLTDNEPKKMDFVFSVHPDCDAKFSDGINVLEEYIRQNVITEIPEGTISAKDLVAVRFIINESGQIVNPEIFQPLGADPASEILLNAVRSMPAWTAAVYDNGTLVKQEFALLIGNLESCTVNWLQVQ